MSPWWQRRRQQQQRQQQSSKEINHKCRNREWNQNPCKRAHGHWYHYTHWSQNQRTPEEGLLKIAAINIQIRPLCERVCVGFTRMAKVFHRTSVWLLTDWLAVCPSVSCCWMVGWCVVYRLDLYVLGRRRRLTGLGRSGRVHPAKTSDWIEYGSLLFYINFQLIIFCNSPTL